VVAIAKTVRPRTVAIEGKKMVTPVATGILMGGKRNPAKINVTPAAKMIGQKLGEGR
jgi:hypothetical protein